MHSRTRRTCSKQINQLIGARVRNPLRIDLFVEAGGCDARVVKVYGGSKPGKS